MSCSPGKCVPENHKFKKKDKKETKDKAEKPEKTEKSEKPEKPEKPEKSEKSEKPDRIERPENGESLEMSEKRRMKVGGEDIVEKIEQKIIRPRFAKDLWLELLSREESEKVVGDIIEYQIQRVMAGNLMVDVKRQRENYSAYWARNYILQKVTLEITCRDEGEGPEESAKTEDSELKPLTIDMWAPRCVPAQQVAPTTEPVDEKVADAVKVRTQPVTRRRPKVQSPRSPDRKTTAVIEPYIFHRKKKQTTPSTKPDVSKSLSLPPASVINSEDVNPTDSLVTIQAASLHQRKSVQKLDPSSFPKHWIIPQYEITDQPCTKPGHKTTGGLSKYMKKNQQCKDGDSRRAIEQRHGITSKESDRK